MDAIQREIKFNIGERNFIAKFPNVGQMIDMESLKQALTNNRYGTMSASGVKSMYMVLDLVDAIAFFQVCVPSVGKYFDIKNYANLQLDEVKDIVQSYLLQIKPWFDVLVKQLYSTFDNGGNNIESQEGSK
jgi:ABC-type enterochelin transport system permease subunit